MGCDMVTALGGATAEGHTLFGHNAACPGGTSLPRLTPGRPFEAGERVRTCHLEVPQVRCTLTVLGTPGEGWGLCQGVNELGVAVGRGPLRTRIPCPQPGLLGDELVRLTLERARSAAQAVELLTDFVRRHGQGMGPGAEADSADNAFLIADGREAFAIETAGSHFVCQQVREHRVLGPLGTVRQDWDRISPGLSEHVIEQGWWPADGSKIDFAASLCPPWIEQGAAVHRWGQAARMLAEQSGHIDLAFLRRLLSLDDEDREAEETGTPCLVADLTGREGQPLIVWTALGAGRLGLFLPLLLHGDLPAELTATGPASESRLVGKLHRLTDRLGRREEVGDLAREAFDRLQARFDLEAEEFAAGAGELPCPGREDDLRRQGTLFMQHCLERFEEVVDGLLGQQRDTPRRDEVRHAAAERVDIFEG